MELQKLIDELKHTNLCTYFVLPLIGVNKLRFGGETNFLNSFLSRDGSLIYVEVYHPEFVPLKLPQHRTCKDTNGKDYLEFKISEKYKADVKLFMAGKYSEMSESSKRLIQEHSTLPYRKLKGTTYNTDVRLLALSKSPVLKAYWDEQLYQEARQSHLTEEMELLSQPDEFSYLEVPLTYT